MGIFDRLSTLIRSNINDLISRAENPEKMLNQLIVDMRGQLARAKQQVAAAIADEKRLAAQVEDEKKSAGDWERRAVLAVQEGRDDLAKQALLRHNEHAQGAVQLHETWVKHREETEKLKVSLRQLNDRIEEAKRKKNILIARQKRAEAHKRIQETMSSIGDKGVFETFERMAEQIEHEERKLIAAAEVNEDLSGDTLVKQFQSLEVKADADQQLLDLKRKMGLLPAPRPSWSRMTTPSTTAEHGAVPHSVVGRHVRGALRCRPGHLVLGPGRGRVVARLHRRTVRGVPLGHHRPARAAVPRGPLARLDHGRRRDARRGAGHRRAARAAGGRADPGARLRVAADTHQHPKRRGRLGA